MNKQQHNRRVVLFIENSIDTFKAFRADIACALKEQGYAVHVAGAAGTSASAGDVDTSPNAAAFAGAVATASTASGITSASAVDTTSSAASSGSASSAASDAGAGADPSTTTVTTTSNAQNNITYHSVPLVRRSINIVTEITTIMALYKLIKSSNRIRCT